MSYGLLTDAELASLQASTKAAFDRSGTRRRYPTAPDRYGNDASNLAAPNDLAIPKLSITQMHGTELRVDRSAEIGDWIGRVPRGTDITGRDQLIVDGVTFEVIGPPEDLGTHLHLELRHIEG